MRDDVSGNVSLQTGLLFNIGHPQEGADARKIVELLEVPLCPVRSRVHEHICADHAQFIATLYGYNSSMPWRNRASHDLAVIQQLFPQIHLKDEWLAMAAWLSFTHFTDEIAREQVDEEAQHALGLARELFRGGYRQAEVVTCAPPARECSFTERLKVSSKILQRQLESLLPIKVLPMVYQRISEVYAAWIEEIRFRENQRPDTKLYLNLKRQGTSIGPWLSMSGNLYGKGQHESLMKLLTDHVTTCLILQKDIISLQDHLTAGDFMNYVVMEQASSSISKAHATFATIENYTNGMKEAASLHNHVSHLARVEYQQIDVLGTADEKRLARSIYYLLSTHLQLIWKIECRRTTRHTALGTDGV